MEIEINETNKKVQCKSYECMPIYREVFDPADCKKTLKQYNSRYIFTLSVEQINYDDIPNECFVNRLIHCYKSPLHADGTFKLIQFPL
jgi:hypothetical protein